MTQPTTVTRQATDLIVSVVGVAEASNIDLEHVERGEEALHVGNTNLDGCLVVTPDDVVTVWAQGTAHTQERIPGAHDHFARLLRQIQVQAVTADGYGDPEVLVFEARWDVDNDGWEPGDPIARAPLAPHDTDGEGAYDIDAALKTLGYHLVGEWAHVDFGAVGEARAL